MKTKLGTKQLTGLIFFAENPYFLSLAVYFPIETIISLQLHQLYAINKKVIIFYEMKSYLFIVSFAGARLATNHGKG